MNEKSSNSKSLARSLEPPAHGGDWGEAERRFGRPGDGWLDLSTGINPDPYPVADVPPEAWHRLPDGAAMGALLAAAAGYYGVADAETVVAVPGSQAAIQWLPRLRPRSRAAVVGPTYAEHAHVWRLAGHQVIEVAGIDAAAARADVVVVVNPNNPDGRTVAPDRLRAGASDLAGRGGWLIVDEAFADVAPGIGVAARAGAPGLIVLRSFGKFFGLAGARLGFVVAEKSLAAALRAALGPWPVAGPAAAVAARAFADSAWIAHTRARLAAGMARLRALLSAHGLAVVGGTDLFVLVEGDGATGLYGHLARQGILARRFPGHDRRLRFGLPGADAAWQRLEDALRSFAAT